MLILKVEPCPVGSNTSVLACINVGVALKLFRFGALAEILRYRAAFKRVSIGFSC